MRYQLKKIFYQFANFLIISGKKILHNTLYSEKSQITNSEEEHIISNLLEFRNLKVGEVMIPRTDIVGIHDSASLEELKAKFIHPAHTRVPVYKGNLDDIIGFVHVKDFIPYIDGSRNFILQDIVRKLIYCPRSAKCIDLLAKMKQNATNIAVVLDEYGGTEGIVLIENLVELIVGDIKDEHEQHSKIMIQRLNDKSYIIDTKASIQEIEEIFSISFSGEDGEYETLGGFILSYLDRIPEKGEKIVHPMGIEIEILEVEPRRIKKVKLTQKAGEEIISSV